MSGDDVEARPLPLSGELSLGRAPTCDLQLDHPSISRSHLVLRLLPDRMEVVDQGGSNGTSMRGARLPAGVAVELAANEPLEVGDLVLVVQDVRAVGDDRPPPAQRPSGVIASAGGIDAIVQDPSMRRLYDLAQRVARGTISVLVVGETGTGKEVLGEFLHRASPRAAGPLVRVNCAAFADSLVESELFGHERGAFTGAHRERKGLLESAEGGTVMLDEVGELPLPLQAKLLRVLEERAVMRVGSSSAVPIDVRFVAATNRDLEAEIEAGRFRRDLYFRLAGAVLAIPPLRERRDEIVPLARAFAADAAARIGSPPPPLTADALAALTRHPWTGNLRELRNTIERAVLLAGTDAITPEHLALAPASASTAAPADAPPAAPLADELANVERQRIVDALAACQGNQTRAAAMLGMPLRTLVKRLTQYDVPRPRKR
jgi:DNA-binding NtrC family response regulator